MEVNCHLNDEEMADVLARPAADTARAVLAHLQLCDACSRELDRLRALVASLGQAAGPAVAAKTEAGGRDFWERQRAQVWRQLAAAEPRTLRWLPVLSAAMAAVILAVAFASRPVARPAKGLEPASDADRQLLVQVEQVVDTDGPEALEPAALLAEQIGGDERASEYADPVPASRQSDLPLTPDHR